ncbi:DUF3168 domain-containing protein [Comamonas koreensis]|uniref:DUF3168 domain-containing protein n=1 Tax=Comamonas koreensis TaxID=160825 RepID=A0AAW4XTI0_9BURK|nr:DUF3168 domain-containing protein [Comamonas koreensis]MCD2164284.1 DUF3168 domain-containing protein [Comamonas koreensis]
MAVEDSLTALLESILPDVFPDMAEEPMPAEFVVYQFVPGEVVKTIANDAPELRNSQVQLTVWTKTRRRSNALMRQIEDLLIQTEVFQARPMASMESDSDADLKLRGSRQDFSIWWK